MSVSSDAKVSPVASGASSSNVVSIDMDKYDDDQSADMAS